MHNFYCPDCEQEFVGEGEEFSKCPTCLNTCQRIDKLNEIDMPLGEWILRNTIE